MTVAPYVALIPLLPLAGATILGLAGVPLQRRLGKAAVSWLACGTVAASFVLAAAAFLQLTTLDPEHRLLLVRLFPWIHVGTLGVDVAFARYNQTGYDGQVFAIFVIMLAAAEAAIGLAIVLGIYQSFETIDVEATDRLRQ